MDNPGHPFIYTVGCVAGDEESYEVFKDTVRSKSLMGVMAATHPAPNTLPDGYTGIRYYESNI